MISGNLTTLARPYASAAFEYALENDALSEWDEMLKNAAYIVENPAIKTLLRSPAVTAEQMVDLFDTVLAKVLDRQKKNFIDLLAANKRLPLLPDIAALFENLKAEYEKTVTVSVVSAVSLDEAYQQKLVKSLTKRLQRQVSLQCEVDPALLGGAVITAGDRVIDGSIRGKLNRLFESL
jgi:F-type H+-transporting ATPase subunit delta